MRGPTTGALLVLLTAVTPLLASPGRSQDRPVFRTGTDRVAMSVVVRKPNGTPVINLKQEDFTLLDNGLAKPIVEFRSEPTAVSLALLVDFSGSMDIAIKLPAARETARQLVGLLTPGVDMVGLYSFDTLLQELQPVAPAPGDVLARLGAMRPFGSTSLYDAIAETGRRIATGEPGHRAVVVLTDGADTTSRMTAEQVSAVASQMDVPVYVIVVVSPLDSSGSTRVDDRAGEARLIGPLGDLARWTGGDIFAASSPGRTTTAAQQIVTELRHQYFIAFEPDLRPGWHPIEVHTRQQNLIVRTRSGYVARSGAMFSSAQPGGMS